MNFPIARALYVNLPCVSFHAAAEMMALAFNVARADGLHALESSVTGFVSVLHVGLLSRIKSTRTQRVKHSD